MHHTQQTLPKRAAEYMSVQPQPSFENRLNEDHTPSLLAGILSALSAVGLFVCFFCHVTLPIFVQKKLLDQTYITVIASVVLSGNVTR